MEYRWKIYRDCDVCRLRKVVVELYFGDELLYRSRMFCIFAKLWEKRIVRRKAVMLRKAKAFVKAMGE